TLIRTWALTGGVSAQITALEVMPPDGILQKMVVRQHGAVDLARNPNVAADEFRLLNLLKTAGLAVPAPYLVAVPYLVVEFIEGETDFAPQNLADTLQQMAAFLAKLHTTAYPPLDFLPRHSLSQRPPQLDESIDEGKIRDVLEAAWPFSTHTTLLHG